MSVVIVGGHDRMVCQYMKICKNYKCKAKVFTQMYKQRICTGKYSERVCCLRPQRILCYKKSPTWNERFPDGGFFYEKSVKKP